MLDTALAMRPSALILISAQLLVSACAAAEPASTAPPAEGTRALAHSGTPSGDSARDSGGWWVDAYSVVNPEDDPRAGRAQAVFERVAAAADKRGNRLPRLVVVGAPGDPFAVALPDGSVILTRGALDFCYGPPGSPRPTQAAADRGDLRMAFVLGHELSHLVRDDFWHRAAFAAAERYPAAGAPAREVRALVRPEPRYFRIAELQADSAGAITMAMAGYSPGDLFRADPDFFARWVAQAGLGSAYDDPVHPAPSQRAASLKTQLAAVVDDLDFFHFGVRLAQLGRYGDAIVFLERFKDRFAGREVLSNLGYANYQLAVKALAGCDGAPAVRFRLPVAIDDETLANRARLRGGHSPCLNAEPVRKHLAEARRYLELAVDKDPAYLPAQRNLLALEIVSGKAAAALALAHDTLALAPGDAATLIAKGVGLYLFGIDSRIETVDDALAVLKEAEGDPRRAPDAVFNQAVIQAERGRTGAAKTAWERFLQLEPHGAHADLARERLGQPAQRVAATAPTARSPIPLGVVNTATTVATGGMESSGFVIGAMRGRFYSGPGVRALQLGDAIEVVEQSAAGPAGGSAVANDSGAVRVESPGGELLRYPGHALDLEGGHLRAVLYFVPAR